MNNRTFKHLLNMYRIYGANSFFYITMFIVLVLSILWWTCIYFVFDLHIDYSTGFTITIVASLIASFLVGKILIIFLSIHLESEKKLTDEARFSVMGAMLGMISHQWRQPLSAILIRVSHLDFKRKINKEVTPQDIENVSNDIKDIIASLTKTIDAIGNFYKPTENIITISIDEVVNKLDTIVLANLKMHNIDVEINIKSNQMINVFLNKFLEALINIIENAKEVLLEKENDRKLMINCFDKNHLLHIEIINNGKNINLFRINEIFEPYYSTKAKNQRGLGLYISKSIIEKSLNGIIDVQNIKNGVKFVIVLPAYQTIE